MTTYVFVPDPEVAKRLDIPQGVEFRGNDVKTPVMLALGEKNFKRLIFTQRFNFRKKNEVEVLGWAHPGEAEDLKKMAKTLRIGSIHVEH